MPSRETDLIGQTIDGKYRVESLLGRGGMGAVFRAVHLGTDRVVAVKVIAPSLAEQPEYLARFSREARACGRLRHPGIVDVTDFGIAQQNGRSLAYLVMEFLDGSTLADALKAQPRPPLPWCWRRCRTASPGRNRAPSATAHHRSLRQNTHCQA